MAHASLLTLVRECTPRVLALALLCLGACARTDPAPLPVRPDLVGFPPALSTEIARAEEGARSGGAAGRLRLGQLYHANGFAAEAHACYAPLASDAEFGARASYLLAHVAEMNGDLAAQRHWLDETLKRDPSYMPAHLLNAEVSFKSGQVAQAVDSYRAALDRSPLNAEALVGLARVRMQGGDVSTAVELLERATAAQPKHSTAHSLLAQAHDRRGDAARAAAAREKARALKDPPRADPWHDELVQQCYDVQRLSVRFEDLAKSGQEEAAAATLRQLEAIDSGHWLVCRMRGLAASLRGREAEAAHEYQRALSAGGDPATLYPALLNSLVSLRRLEDAESTAASGLALLPDAPALLLGVANLRLAQSRQDDALALIRRALTHDQQNVGANRALVRLLWQRGQYDEALPRLEFIRRVATDDLAARAMLGDYYLDHSQPAAAVEPLEEALALEPGNTHVRERLALACLRVGNQHARERQFDRAIGAYDRAIATKPDYLEALTNKVQVCAVAGRPDESERTAQRVLALQPRDPALFLKLGDVAQAAGKPAAAADYWRRAHRLLDADADPRLRDAVSSRLRSTGAARQSQLPNP